MPNDNYDLTTGIYFAGDRVELTGATYFQYGTQWAVFVYLEGHKKGEEGVFDMNSSTYTCQVKQPKETSHD